MPRSRAIYPRPRRRQPIPRSTQLCAASKSGNGDRIRALLQQDADANASCTDEGEQVGPLSLAVSSDNFEAVKALLAAGVDVEAAGSKYGLTPLFLIRSPAIGKILLSFGAKIDTRNKDGQTPF
jgi:ankyrin repeat protein